MNNSNTFRKTRLTLTAWYLTIIMLITMIFSVVIYFGINQDLSRIEKFKEFSQSQKGQTVNSLIEEFKRQGEINGEDTVPGLGELTPDAVSEIRFRLITTLVLVNLGILSIAGFAGYFLAGRTLRPINEMMDEQNRFITDASHELKTPLTSLRTEFEVAMLEGDISKQESKKLIKSSFEEVVRLQGLAEKLIELTQLNKGKVILDSKEIGLLNVIEGALKKVVPIAKQKQITINNQVDDYLLKGEFQSLCEVFVILLDNAIKYSPQKTEITLTSQTNDHRVEIHVIDQGIGISQKNLPHIFNRFYRADKSRSTSGYGLGLSIAKEIVSRHRGSISVESLKDKGTDFTVRLPIISTA